jgi:hypothetical protein
MALAKGYKNPILSSLPTELAATGSIYIRSGNLLLNFKITLYIYLNGFTSF